MGKRVRNRNITEGFENTILNNKFEKAGKI